MKKGFGQGKKQRIGRQQGKDSVGSFEDQAPISHDRVEASPGEHAAPFPLQKIALALLDLVVA